MPRFRVIHRFSGETWEVEATCAENARQSVGWSVDVCRILMLVRPPYAEIIPPKVAIQITPPVSGSYQICPVCFVTMIERTDYEFWWQCPSCDRLYHEWENKFYEAGEI